MSYQPVRMLGRLIAAPTISQQRTVPEHRYYTLQCIPQSLISKNPPGSRSKTVQTVFQTFHPSQWCVHLDPGKDKMNYPGYHKEIYLSNLSSFSLLYCFIVIINNNYCQNNALMQFRFWSLKCAELSLSRITYDGRFTHQIYWLLLFLVYHITLFVSECFSFWNHSCI